MPVTAKADLPRAKAPPSPPNGHSTKPSEGPRPVPPRELPSPPSVSHRSQPTTVDQPVSQEFPSSSSTKQAHPFSGPVPSLPTNVKGHTTPKPDVEAEKATKKSNNVFVRTLWTFIMLGGFLGQRNTIYKAARELIRIVLGCLLMGHVCMIILVFLCQTIVYREVTRLFTLMDSKPVEYGGRDPWSKTLSWYFFATANYFLYGESIIHYFKVLIHCAISCSCTSRVIVACCLCRRKLSPVRHKP